MAIQLGDAVIRITGDLSAFNSSLALAQKNALSSFGAIGMAARQIGVVLTGVGVAGIAGLGGVVKVAATFEQAITTAASVTGRAGAEFEETKKKLSELAQELGIRTVFTARQAANAFINLGRKGIDVASLSVEDLIPILDLAAGQSIGLTEAADLVTSTMKSFGLEFSESTRIADLFSAAANRTNTTMEKLTVALPIIGATANLAGISLEELTAVLGVLFDRGVLASTAATGLRRVISSLHNPTKAFREVISEMGLTMDDVNPKTKSLSEIMRVLGTKGVDAEKAFQAIGIALQTVAPDFDQAQLTGKNLGEVLTFLKDEGINVGGVLEEVGNVGIDTGGVFRAFGQRAAVMAGVLSQNVDELDRLSESFKDVEGTAKRIREQQLDTLIGQFTLFTSAIEGVALALGEVLLPSLKSIVEWLTPWVRDLAKLIKEHPKLTIAVEVAVAAMSLMALAVGGLLIALSLVLVPLASFAFLLGGGSSVAGLAGAAAAAGGAIKLAALELTAAGGLTGALEAATLKTTLAAAASSKWVRVLGVGIKGAGLIGALIWMADSIWGVISAEKKLSDMQKKVNDISVEANALTLETIQRLRNEGVTFDELTEKILRGKHKQAAVTAIATRFTEMEEDGVKAFGDTAEREYRRIAQEAVTFAKSQEDTSVKVVGFWTNILNAIQSAIISAGEGGTQVPNIGGGGFAGGTISARGGMSIVGESGPEIVNLKRGDQVTPAAQSRGMMGGATFNGPLINIQNVDAGSQSDMDDLDRKLGQIIGRALNSQGMQLGTA